MFPVFRNYSIKFRSFNWHVTINYKILGRLFTSVEQLLCYGNHQAPVKMVALKYR